MLRLALLSIIALGLSACESNPPAPVIDRLPQSSSKPKPPATAPTNNKANQTVKTVSGKDWRPDSHIVKKGDTLFSIGLEYGYDYKESAAANNITEPYPIRIGQKLNLASLQTKANPVDSSQVTQTEDGVVVTPIKTEAPAAETKPIQSAVTPILNEPKAIREPYSLEALNKSAPVNTTVAKITTAKSTEVNPKEAKPTDAKAIEAKPVDNKQADDEAIAWSWPTQGKVIAGFNDATNKGLDIGGVTGQAINAASTGKVIYSGSDLRGYGKLVIIKHNKTYLSVYAHNSKIIVKEGQVVAAGQKIAEMGNTDSNGVKLHFEIRRLGKSVDPAKFLNQN